MFSPVNGQVPNTYAIVGLKVKARAALYPVEIVLKTFAGWRSFFCFFLYNSFTILKYTRFRKKSQYPCIDHGPTFLLGPHGLTLLQERLNDCKIGFLTALNNNEGTILVSNILKEKKRAHV